MDGLRRDLVRLDGMYQSITSEKNRLQEEMHRTTMDGGSSRSSRKREGEERLEKENRKLWERVRQLEEAERTMLGRSGVSNAANGGNGRREQSISLAHLLDDLDRTQQDEPAIHQLTQQKREL